MNRLINKTKISILSEYFKFLKINKLNKVPKEEVDNLINSLEEKSSKILHKYKENNSDKQTFLLVGNVQSGKTMNFTSSLFKFFDDNSNFSIIISGVNNELYRQNYERIHEFIYSDNFEIKRKISLFDYKKLDQDQLKKDFEDGKKIIITVLKNHKSLFNIINVIKKIKNMIVQPIVIDDEGDQYSFLNINKFKKNNELSKTYEMINNLLLSLEKYLLLTVTATPYAHILSDDLYGEYVNVLKPNFAFVIPQGKNYFGLDSFLEGNEEKQIIEEIDKDEIHTMFTTRIMCDSLKKALCYFMLNGFIYYNTYKKCSCNVEMLIHVDIKNANNQEIYNILRNYIDNEFFDAIKDEKKDEFKYLSNAIEDINEIYGYNEEGNKEPKVNIDHFLKIVKESNLKNEFDIHLITNKRKYEVSNKIFSIIIGSKKIDRGNTFNNLIVSYVSKRAIKEGNVDTILQMCRWFGYRMNYKKLIKVWLLDTLLLDYQSIAETNSQLIEVLKEMEKNKKPFNNMGKSVYIEQHNWNNSTLKATRSTVAKQEILVNTNYIYNKFFKEIIFYQDENKINKTFWDKTIEHVKNGRNIFNLESISNNLDNYKSICFNDYNSFVNAYCSEMYLKKIFESIYLKDDFSDSNKVDILQQIKKISNEKNKKIVVSLMTKKIKEDIGDFNSENLIRKRSFNKQLKCFFCIEKGPNENYVGDKYWDKESSDYIFIQIHKIKPNNVSLKTGTDDNCVYKIIIVSKEKIIRYKNNIVTCN